MDEKELKALYDAMSKKLGLSDFNSFKSQIEADNKFRKAFYDEASHDLELGDYNTFDSRVKKKSSSNVGVIPSGNGLSTTQQVEIPQVS